MRVHGQIKEPADLHPGDVASYTRRTEDPQTACLNVSKKEESLAPVEGRNLDFRKNRTGYRCALILNLQTFLRKHFSLKLQRHTGRDS